MAEEIDLNWLISVDDHVLEPRNVWQDRVPARYRDAAPRLVSDDSGEYWLYSGKRSPSIGLSAVAGKRAEEFKPEPIPYAEMRAGCYDSVARLQDMDQAGILGSLCFPSFPRFCGQVFLEADDHDLALICVRAYNDWMIDEWCGSAPGRFIPLILIPLWDPVLAAGEVDRCAAKGAHAVAFSENPYNLGLPTVQSPHGHWDPLWRACADADVVVCMHTGSSSAGMMVSPESPPLVFHAYSGPAKISGALLEWLFSPALQKFDNLKIALSEGGIGWMPYFLERATHTVATHRYWANRNSVNLNLEELVMTREPGKGNEIDLMAFDVRQTFRDHVYGCFIDDLHGVRSIDEIGVDNVMIETDYPHSDSTWPNCIAHAREQLASLSDADAYKVLRGNAERVFSFAPTAPPTSGNLARGAATTSG